MKISAKKITLAMMIVFLISFILMPFKAYGDEGDFTQEELDYIKENPIVITAVDPFFVPFEFMDNDGNYKGIAADYIKLIEIKTGLTFKILEGLTWPEAYDLALEGKVDLLPCVGITDERAIYFLFTEGYFKYQRAILSLADDAAYKFNDLEKISVGVQRNSSNYSFITYETDIEPVLYEDIESLLLALSVGEIDAVVANYASAKYTANQLGITNIKADEILDSETTELAMAVNHDKPILVSILNKALAQISEEQKIVIRNKWLGIEKEADYSTIYRYLIVGVMIALTTIIIFFFWNRTLKKHIADRKEAEQKVKLLLESAGEGIIGVDTTGRINFINPTALELLGYEEEEITGESLHELIHHSNEDFTEYDLFSCPIRRTYTLGEKNHIYDEVLWCKDKTSFDVEYTSVPIVKNHNIQGAVIVLKNITERKKQQEEIKKALEKVEKLYAASLAIRSTININEVLKTILCELKEVVSFDSATIQEYKEGLFEIIYCEGFINPEKLIGVKFAEEKGAIYHKVLVEKSSVVMQDVRKHNEFIDMSDNKNIKSFMAVPLIINNKVIGELTLDSHTLDYYNREMASTVEAFASQASIALNNSKIFEELEKAKTLAEQATKAKGDFLANMSHEIRTPMNAIIGLLSLLGYTNLEQKQKDYVKKIENASKNLLAIINDILDYSKIESGKLRKH